MPVLIIDLLAKADKQLHNQAVTHAKVLANADDSKLVLVSSKGSLILLIENFANVVGEKSVHLHSCSKLPY